ncbi:hypothetical protein OCU04_005814 [Sclerotinia nivalis]|uniref:Uncharacterized protein n=1 Tax=Sclerotinia nivalis TaxID=352851 RepID=A0A9X0DIS7_9HELO|nr:hypothetical protein OCU04_005814 [Sclerotinia nivalis]
MPSQTSCTLYTFPRELRDPIYGFAQEEWVKDPIVWSEDQFSYGIENGKPWRKSEPITYFNSSPLEIALIPDRQLYREALESRLKKSTLVLAYGGKVDANFTDYDLSKLARKCIASVVLQIPDSGDGYRETVTLVIFGGTRILIMRIETPYSYYQATSFLWRPSWMLKGLDSLFDVKAVPEVEDPDQDLSELRPEYVIRTWHSNKGENLFKGQ